MSIERIVREARTRAMSEWHDCRGASAESAARHAARAALEEAARVADGWSGHFEGVVATLEIAAAIRAIGDS